MSHDCNLRCQYCFASTGDFGTGHRMTMDVETAKKAIDFVIQRSGSRRNIEVDFFGGEPLMAMDTVKATVDYARSLEEKHGKNFRFTITTNGVLLNEENIAYILSLIHISKELYLPMTSGRSAVRWSCPIRITCTCVRGMTW